MLELTPGFLITVRKIRKLQDILHVGWHLTLTLGILEFEHSEALLSTVKYSTVQYSTLQYSTLHYSTYITVQYSTLHYSHSIDDNFISIIKTNKRVSSFPPLLPCSSFVKKFTLTSSRNYSVNFLASQLFKMIFQFYMKRPTCT